MTESSNDGKSAFIYSNFLPYYVQVIFLWQHQTTSLSVQLIRPLFAIY